MTVTVVGHAENPPTGSAGYAIVQVRPTGTSAHPTQLRYRESYINKNEHGYGFLVPAFVAVPGMPPVLVSHTRCLIRTPPKWLIEA